MTRLSAVASVTIALINSTDADVSAVSMSTVSPAPVSVSPATTSSIVDLSTTFLIEELAPDIMIFDVVAPKLNNGRKAPSPRPTIATPATSIAIEPAVTASTCPGIIIIISPRLAVHRPIA